MKVCLFHPKLLPPKDYGGVERVVLWLAAGLRERGHEVWVAALEGSRMPAGVKLLPMRPQSTSAQDFLAILPQGMDVVHFMAPPEAGIMEQLPCASLLTVHGNGKPGELFPVNTVFLSQDHAHRHGAEIFVHNGIDPAEYHFDPKSPKADWMLFLSKTSWSVKNLSGAMAMCSQARVPLRIAGGNRPLARRIQAGMSARMHWEGPVANTVKARLLSEARALVFPVVWPEPFGLVVAEALMSGTPVFASKRGSLSELISSDVGLLLPSPDGEEAQGQWIEALRSAGSRRGDLWDAQACRERALKKFHYLKMAESYENAYKRVAGGERLHEQPPVASDWKAEGVKT